MKEAIRQRARELGFDECRFTTAQPPASAPQFQDWLKARRHGEMAYLERNAARRVNPQLVLPGARTVIVLAASYAQSGECRVSSDVNPTPVPRHPSPVTHHGLVARYARFADYHKALGERLKSLTTLVDQLGGTGTHSLWYVDTGPLLERRQTHQRHQPKTWQLDFSR